MITGGLDTFHALAKDGNLTRLFVCLFFYSLLKVMRGHFSNSSKSNHLLCLWNFKILSLSLSLSLSKSIRIMLAKAKEGVGCNKEWRKRKEAAHLRVTNCRKKGSSSFSTQMRLLCSPSPALPYSLSTLLSSCKIQRTQTLQGMPYRTSHIIFLPYCLTCLKVTPLSK